MSASANPEWREFQGKTVDDAVADGLRRLGLSADAALIEVINKGSRGLFGIGSEPAVVRIAPKPAPIVAPEPAPAPVPPPIAPSPGDIQAQSTVVEVAGAPASPSAAAPETAASGDVAAEDNLAYATDEESAPHATKTAHIDDDELARLATELLQTMVRLMGFTAVVQAEWRAADAITSDRHLLLNLHGQNLSPLIGRRGDTLENIQYLLRLMVNQKVHRWLNIVVDVDGFRVKRVDHLTQLAHRMADQVASTGRPFALEPMPPNERRIIHLALRDDHRVITESAGEGDRRKVTIAPVK